MITISTASKVLKTKYGPLLSNQLNDNTSPFHQMVERTSKYAIGGNEFVMASPIGINGGIGSITETGALPTAGYQAYENLKITPKSIAGVFRITDKAWKSAQTSEDAFIRLFTSESRSLEKGTKWDMNRQMWGNGSGIMATLAALGVAGDTFTVSTGIQNFIEGQIIDIYDYSGAAGALAKKVDRARVVAVTNKPGGTFSIKVKTYAGAAVSVTLVAGGGGELPYVTMQGSSGNEITGLGALHDPEITTLYSLAKADNPWLVPYSTSAGNAISDAKIQDMMNYLEDYYGTKINLIQAGAGAYTAYYAYLEATKRNINTLNLAGGFSGIAYGDKPIVRDRFAPSGDMQFLETEKWHCHQLGEWDWIDGYAGEGNILQQVAGYAYYQATLIKHCELMCEHPGGQGKLTDSNAI
jgi:hypothetical protein